MKKEITILMLAFAVIVIMAGSAVSQEWAINGNYTESCCCNMACPCVFGSPPTMGHCEGNSLLEIKEGHYGNVKLDDISVVTAFRFGEWVKVYVDEKATAEQAEAAVELMKLEPTFGAVFAGNTKILSNERVPVLIEKSTTNIKFSVPASSVEIEKVKGWDGEPIKIQNLPIPFMRDYVQYKSIAVSHHSEDKEFSYSGTNGLTSRIEASSKFTTEK